MPIEEMIQMIIAFIRDHQMWVIPIIFLLAFAESLAIVSLLLPATTILLGCGVLVGGGLILFTPIFLASSAGAIVGDWVSFWLGKHYHQQIINVWPLKKHPKAIARAERFFHKYGVMGIFIGRFFGPLRAFLPLVAGAMHMPSFKFNIGNVVSAPIWSFVMLAPGTFGLHWLETVFG